MLWQFCVWRDFSSDKAFAFGPITTCSDSFWRSRSSYPHSDKWNHVIYGIDFVVAFPFVIRIHITHKWNLSLRGLFSAEHMSWFPINVYCQLLVLMSKHWSDSLELKGQHQFYSARVAQSTAWSDAWLNTSLSALPLCHTFRNNNKYLA